MTSVKTLPSCGKNSESEIICTFSSSDGYLSAGVSLGFIMFRTHVVVTSVFCDLAGGKLECL